MIVNNCPLCGSDKFSVISGCKKEVIVECICGVWYKREIDEHKKTHHYKSGHIWQNDFYENRYKKISKYLWDKIRKDGSILDIGCGNGRMLDNIKAYFKNSSLEGNESSIALFPLIKYPIIADRFDNADFKGKKYDVVVCMGVDYLFLNHDKAMQKIKSILKDDGKLYIERNVFRDMKSFYREKTKDVSTLLWKNMLITTWFTEEQMEKQLDKYFNRIEKLVYGEPVTRCVGWLCSQK